MVLPLCTRAIERTVHRLCDTIGRIIDLHSRPQGVSYLAAMKLADRLSATCRSSVLRLRGSNPRCSFLAGGRPHDQPVPRHSTPCSACSTVTADRHFQIAYRKVLSDHQLVGALSRHGNLYDHPEGERFMKTLKVETEYPTTYTTLGDVAGYALTTSISSPLAIFTRLSRSNSSPEIVQPEERIPLDRPAHPSTGSLSYAVLGCG